jgi:hypothetical protein
MTGPADLQGHQTNKASQFRQQPALMFKNKPYGTAIVSSLC